MLTLAPLTLSRPRFFHHRGGGGVSGALLRPLRAVDLAAAQRWISPWRPLGVPPTGRFQSTTGGLMMVNDGK